MYSGLIVLTLNSEVAVTEPFTLVKSLHVGKINQKKVMESFLLKKRVDEV